MNKNKFYFLLFFLVSFYSINAQNNKPIFSNVNYENNTASKTLTITFDLIDNEEQEVTVDLRASYNNGENFFVKTDTAYGDIGENITIGNDKKIVWYYGDIWNNILGKTIRLIVDDGYQINIDDIVAQVDTNRMRKMLEYIAKPRSFDVGADHLLAVRDTMKDLFSADGYTVKTQSFSFENNTGENIIGKKSGLTKERNTIVMDAHYDAFFNAPGADDNGSGVVAFLEAARILSAYDFEKSLEFIGFDQEENFLLGSINYTFFGGIEPWKKVDGVLNYEMIGYYSEDEFSQVFPEGFDLLFPSQYEQLIQDSFRGNFIFLVGNMASIGLVNAYEAAAIDYIPDLKVISGIVPLNGLIAPDLLRSDHAPFWFAGVPAIMITDGAEFRNEDYHTVNDVVENLDFEFMGNVTKACMAAMIDLAGIKHATYETFVIEENIVTSSISNAFQKCNVKVFPNPAVYKLNVQLGNCLQLNEPINLTIYDIAGRMVKSVLVNNLQHTFNIEDLSCGQYNLEILQKNQSRSFNFIVAE